MSFDNRARQQNGRTLDLMLKTLIAILMIFGASSQATEIEDWPLTEQCLSARYIVVGHLELVSPPPQVEDDGTLRRGGWVGGRLRVDRSLAGGAREDLSVSWFACCPEEVQSVEVTGVNRGVLRGIWLIFPDAKGISAVWHPMSSLSDVRTALRSVGK